MRSVFFLLLLTLTLNGCSDSNGASERPVEVEVTRLVTVVPQSSTAEVTRLVVVTATPVAANAFTTTDPDYFTEVLDRGPLTLDPILARDVASRGVLQNVLEPLIYPHPKQANEFVPVLASGWSVSADGLTYSFRIRGSVRFSNGNVLAPSDIAYSLQRLLLASPMAGPQHLLLEPLLGFTSGDVTETFDNGAHIRDRASLIANTSNRELFALCERVQRAIVADDANSTLTFHLEKPWAPFLAALSQPWAAAIDKEWAAQRGAWDANCSTWQEWYALTAAESALDTHILGTGPYVLDHWAPGAEYVLVANENYWRSERDEMWEAGPVGLPTIKTVRVQQVPEPHLRWDMLRNGEVAMSSLSAAGQILADQLVGASCDWQTGACSTTDGPGGPLREYPNVPIWTQHALFFNHNIPLANNSYIGSGQLDGNGIPANFFNDVHIRRAFGYCFDKVSFVETALDGNGIVAAELIPSFLMEGVQETAGTPFDLTKCEDELLQAWDGQLASTGFRFQIPIESGDRVQQSVAVELQSALREVNPAYVVEIVGLPRPLYVQALHERRLPLALLKWQPELPDPHYWVAPPFSGDVAVYQDLPPDLQQRATSLILEGRMRVDTTQRRQVYATLNQLRAQTVPFLLLPQPVVRLHQQRWVRNWFYNPAAPFPYYYAYALNGE